MKAQSTIEKRERKLRTECEYLIAWDLSKCDEQVKIRFRRAYDSWMALRWVLVFSKKVRLA